VRGPDRVEIHWVGLLATGRALARRALEIMREARDSRPDAIIGKDPVGAAGAAVYLAAKLLGAGDHLTETRLANALGITEMALRHDVHSLGYRLDRDTHTWVKMATNDT